MNDPQSICNPEEQPWGHVSTISCQWSLSIPVMYRKGTVAWNELMFWFLRICEYPSPLFWKDTIHSLNLLSYGNRKLDSKNNNRTYIESFLKINNINKKRYFDMKNCSHQPKKKIELGNGKIFSTITLVLLLSEWSSCK